MSSWRELLLETLLLGTVSLTAAAAIMIVHGLLIYRRLRSSQSITECVTKSAWCLGATVGLFSLLLLTQARAVPWDWLGTLALLVATAPALLVWLGPPEEHVEASNLCQIGRGSAFSHYYGYLRLMRGQYSVRKRLGKFLRDNLAGLSVDELRDFRPDAVVVLAPRDGEYPSGDWSELRGVGSKRCEVPDFTCNVGGNNRSYGKFKVHEVTGSDGQKCYVALDKVDALATMRKLQNHGPANLSRSDLKKQMEDMMDELERIIEKNNSLKNQLVVVRYDPEEHVGDAIMASLPISRGSD